GNLSQNFAALAVVDLITRAVRPYITVITVPFIGLPAVMIMPVLIGPVVYLLITAVQRAIALIEFPVHPVTLTIEAVSLAIEFGAAFIGHVGSMLMIPVMVITLPLIDI